MRRILAITLALAICAVTKAQSNFTMSQTGTATLHIAAGDSLSIQDPGGDGFYPNSCNTSLTITCDSNATLSLTGLFDTEYGCDIITVYGGMTFEAPVLAVYSGIGNASATSNANALTLHFISDVFVSKQGFTMTVRADTANWHPADDTLVQVPSCIAFDNLHSSFVTAQYGSYLNPRQYDGLVDSGYSSPLSRHTVHNDTSERDPRTNGLLRTVPPGHTSSVRLGNWQTGGQAESITYRCRIDTNASDLLILRYAAVLQNPNHSSSEQPRFAFKILDSNYVEIDPSCYSSTFVASQSLGWNIATPAGQQHGPHASSVLWKDWTAVGIDLTPLHGRSILLRLTSYDCARQEHYGYAYFTLECTNKHITTQTCGTVTQQLFTAPDGFAYRWHPASNPDTTISTSQSLQVSQAGQYICTLSFIGSSDSGNCSFDLSVTATERHPNAHFTLEQWNDSCTSWITAANQSNVCGDDAHTQTVWPYCDSIQWFVDDLACGSSDTLMLPVQYGLHDVRLIAMLEGGCADTTSQQLFVDYPCHIYDTLVVSLCQGESFLLFDTLVSQSGTYRRDSLNLHRLLNLTIHPTYVIYDTMELRQNQLPLVWNGIVFDTNSLDSTPGIIADVTNLTAHLSSTNVCDSTRHLNLTVWRNVSSSADSSICRNAAPLLWNGIVFDSSRQQTVILSGAGMHGVDSTVTMNVTIRENSNLTRHDTIVENNLPHLFGGNSFASSQPDTSWLTTNAAGCDSMVTYSLVVWPNVHTYVDTTTCQNQLPLNYGGTSFHSATSTSWTLPTWHGADSIIHFTINVNPSYLLATADSICQSQEAYRWFFPIDASWPRTDTLKHHELTTLGCDSSFSLVLTVNPIFSSADTSHICLNHLPYSWHSHIVDSSLFSHHTTSFFFIDTLTSRQGCDSITSLQLTVMPSYAFHDTLSICHDDLPLQWGDTTLYDINLDHGTIDKERHLTSSDGCDSNYHLNLTLFPTSHAYHHALVCDGVPYTWVDGNTYERTTHDPIILDINQYGCDSVTHLYLDLEQGFRTAMQITPLEVSTFAPQVTLRDLSPSGSRCWFVAGMTDTNKVFTFDFPPNSDTLEILLVARSHIGCIDSAWGIVRCDRSAFYVPNAFTPDEPTNNLFRIFSNSLASAEVWVFSRSGLLVAHFDGLNQSWNGTHNGMNCPQAAYTWILTYTTVSQPNIRQQAKGTVTLIR